MFGSVLSHWHSFNSQVDERHLLHLFQGVRRTEGSFTGLSTEPGGIISSPTTSRHHLMLLSRYIRGENSKLACLAASRRHSPSVARPIDQQQACHARPGAVKICMHMQVISTIVQGPFVTSALCRRPALYDDIPTGWCICFKTLMFVWVDLLHPRLIL